MNSKKTMEEVDEEQHTTNNNIHHQEEEEADMVMPGFRFHPTEEELVEFYLRRKVEGKRFQVDLITLLDLYRYDPWELPGMAAIGEKEWYFYVPRDRKYRNGDRPNRVTTSGYWKATGADRMIRSDNNFRSIGLKKTLVFYSGKAPKGIRTSWIMNEYRLPQHETLRNLVGELSLCRVYKRAGVMEDHHHQPLPRSSYNNTKKQQATIRTTNNNIMSDETEASSSLVSTKTTLFGASSSSSNAVLLFDDLHKLINFQAAATTTYDHSNHNNLSEIQQQPVQQFYATMAAPNHETTLNNSCEQFWSAPPPSDAFWEWNPNHISGSSSSRSSTDYPFN